MANETTSNLGRRTKRTTAVVLGLVAMLAGVAVAFFLTEQRFDDNVAKGGQLTVDVGEGDFPLDFTGGGAACHTATGQPADPDTCETLFPVNATTVEQAGDAALESEFSVTNGNPVPTSYLIYATCASCTDTANPNAAQELDQYEHLMVSIYNTPAVCNEICQITGAPALTKHYEGKLSELNAGNKKALGAALTANSSRNLTVSLWLLNDQQNEQAQMVLSDWEFFIEAKTPA